MHLLAATVGRIDDGDGAVDLGQTPGDIVVLSAAESELACLAAAHRHHPTGGFTLRLASLLSLAHPLSVDLYVESVIIHARLVVVRVLGGRGYWPYGVEQIGMACRQRGIPVAFLPGDAQPDPELAESTSMAADQVHRLWQYLVEGGEDNAGQFLAYAASLLGYDARWREPIPLPPVGRWSLPAYHPQPGQPLAVVVFYRSLVQAGNTAVIAGLADALAAEGLAVVAFYVTSLKDPLVKGVLAAALEENPPDVILNGTGFAVSTPGQLDPDFGPFATTDCPVLQVVFASGSEAAWRAGSRGLAGRDIAMSVALPEVDGRILAGVVSFKAQAVRDPLTQCPLVSYQPVPDRVAFTARLAARWVRLRRTPAPQRRVAIILSNYPTRDGRLGNGVGLDTPAATGEIIKALAEAGYDIGTAPCDGAALIGLLQAGPTNALAERGQRRGGVMAAPPPVPSVVLERWGVVSEDPHWDAGALRLSLHRFGNICVGVQPARGYHIDPSTSYHNPALVPPHGYLAFYHWIRETFAAHAVVHVGKHGTLEWLPGKSLALSAGCFPEVVLGPMPHLYPFIVNDPGEGTQAKRRAQAVIIDHLTPPLARAESYGPLRDLEALVDEYYEAAGVDPRRVAVLRGEILALAQNLGLDRDVGITVGEAAETALAKLDNHLCDLKEMQIRDGLHIFGRSPTGDLRRGLLVALARVGQPSLQRAITKDLGLGFDPLLCSFSEPWMGPRPLVLGEPAGWRSVGDTVERIEALAFRLVAGETVALGPATALALEHVRKTLAPAIDACGKAEIDGLLSGLAGRFVAPGPSGAPTRGRPEVLPTGRNFYSVDTRVVPTPAAWTLGWASAQALCERHAQDYGQWPRTLALTAWGTACMRTGGDDIAQGLALMGVKPTWDSLSRRVTGFEIIPASLLDRPRVDVTLRISGFFRDAFPGLVDLFDSAARAVAGLDEAETLNPLAARVRAEGLVLRAAGVGEVEAAQQAGARVFGSQPGAYGAGLQAFIDEGGWVGADDLARAYVAWGGWAYGAGAEGQAAHSLFETRLGQIDGVVQNQDNREHDILDSDDYYQFHGGMTAAVRLLSGRQPAVWHGDHSRPENPRIRSLKEEIARVVRGRAGNPKWIAGCLRHGYKGAFEMAATVDYLFAFAATARVVDNHHFDTLFEAYMADEVVRGFMAEVNPAALREMADRFSEAIARGLWQPRRNSVTQQLETLRTKP